MEKKNYTVKRQILLHRYYSYTVKRKDKVRSRLIDSSNPTSYAGMPYQIKISGNPWLRLRSDQSWKLEFTGLPTVLLVATVKEQNTVDRAFGSLAFVADV
jgi:hypothetical protein